VILDAADFKEVNASSLPNRIFRGWKPWLWSCSIQSANRPRVSLFNSADPIVHNRVFGIADFDLNTRKFSFAPIALHHRMTGLQVTPDKKAAFTVVSNGTKGKAL